MQYILTADLLFEGLKDASRRPARERDRLQLATETPRSPKSSDAQCSIARYLDDYLGTGRRIVAVYREMSAGGYIQLYRVGKRYAIQRGRGKRACGSFKLTSIGLEYLQDMDGFDAYHEGIRADLGQAWNTEDPPVWEAIRHDFNQAYIDAFVELWDKLHTGTAYTWQYNPLVYVLGIGEVIRNG